MSDVTDDHLTRLTFLEAPAAGSLTQAAAAAIRLETECRSSIRKALADRETYASLAGTIRQIASDYRDRAVFELIQNAHDAHSPAGGGEIFVRLKRLGEGGELYVANRGLGFNWQNVEAVRRPARSTKAFGEGIGNKGLGFRSVHILSERPEVYSCQGEGSPRKSFDGFCFRFANDGEAVALLKEEGASDEVASPMLRDMPRSLLTLPITEQPPEIVRLAQLGFATVVRIPLDDEDAVASADAQIRELLNEAAPPILFLDRLTRLTVERVAADGVSDTRTVERRSKRIENAPTVDGCPLRRVSAGRGEYLLVRKLAPREGLERAIRSSLRQDQRLESWLDSEEDTWVSLAIPLGADKPKPGRVYCFLPLGEAAESPILGHIDAPFLVSLNRKTLDPTIPLNSFFLDLLAATALEAASQIAALEPGVLNLPARVIIDMVGWREQDARRLTAARPDFDDMAIFPVTGARWATYATAYEWKGAGRYLSAEALAEVAGALILDPRLGEVRLQRVRSLSIASKRRNDLEPDGDVVAGWVSAVAARLAGRRKPLALWGEFLDEAAVTLPLNSVGLSCLQGTKIFLDRDGELLKAQAADSSPVYLSEKAGGRSKRARVPAPPRALKRRILFVHEDVAMGPTTKVALIRAHLATDYDPLAVLANMPSLLARNPKPDTLRQVLDWAFQISTAFGKDAIDSVKAAHLSVPTTTGWKAADAAFFSEGWSDDGRRLERVSRELAAESADLDKVASHFLTSTEDWALPKDQSVAHWRDFLTIAGVWDGLRPLACTDGGGGTPASHWEYLFKGWKQLPGVDQSWREEVKETNFGFRYTEYVLEDGTQIWRLPGQSHHGQLSDEGALDYALLLLSHVSRFGAHYMTFTIVPWHRRERKELATPLGVFLRQAEWLPAAGADLAQRLAPSDLWWRRTRAGGIIPRVLGRPHEEVRQQISDANWRALIEDLGLNDWTSKASAGRRLEALANAVEGGPVAEADRSAIRTACQTAWDDILEGGQTFPELEVIVATRLGELILVQRSDQSGEGGTVYVSDQAASFETRLLGELGQPIIECDQARALASRLREAGFDTVAAEDAEIAIKVDGDDYSANRADPLLIDSAGTWLADLAELCLEAEGRGLAKQISRSQFRAAFNRVRICFAQHVDVTVAGQSVLTHGETFLHYKDGDALTVISAGRPAIDWTDLGDLGRVLERLIDRRADGALRTGFTILAASMAGSAFARPTDEQIAAKLVLPVARVRELSQGRANDLHAFMDTLAPALFCIAGEAIAFRFAEAISEAVEDFDPVRWLGRAGIPLPLPAAEFVDHCLNAEDRNTLRRALHITLADFNAALIALGQPQLENRADLRGQFDYALRQLKPELLERLRDRYAGAYRAGDSLAEYVQRRSLTFVTFVEAWLTTREKITEDDLRARVDEVLGSADGAHRTDRPPLTEVRSHNQKVVGAFLEVAAPLVHAWCAAHGQPVPHDWEFARPELLRRLDAQGLLDFEKVDLGSAPGCFRRAGLWPAEMLQSLDAAAHKIPPAKLAEAERQRAARRHQAEIESRQIAFNGQAYDGGSEADLENLATAARAEMAGDRQLTKRFIEGVMEPMSQSRVASRDPRRSGNNTGGGRERPMTDAQKRAVGLLGEVRAFEWIKRRHKLSDAAAVETWISKNRREGLGDSGGDDDQGFDFEVILKGGRRYQYEVKASRQDPGEFELGSSEVRAALSASPEPRGYVQYKILYVPHVADLDWRVFELPNPMSPSSRAFYQERGKASLRLGFKAREA